MFDAFQQERGGLEPPLNIEALYSWWQSFSAYLTARLDTRGDLTLMTKGRGVVMMNAAGTVTKRVRLNDAGDGLIFEDVA
jgi:hypothetical protein